MIPAATSLISQIRKPSFCPPKAYTKGRSGQHEAQNTTPCSKVTKHVVSRRLIILKNNDNKSQSNIVKYQKLFGGRTKTENVSRNGEKLNICLKYLCTYGIYHVSLELCRITDLPTFRTKPRTYLFRMAFDN